jgi:hypothetical protein
MNKYIATNFPFLTTEEISDFIQDNIYIKNLPEDSTSLPIIKSALAEYFKGKFDRTQ